MNDFLKTMGEQTELQRIKAEHAAIKSVILSAARVPGDIVDLRGARAGQVGLSAPLIDEAGGLWRLLSGDRVQFCGRVVDND